MGCPVGGLLELACEPKLGAPLGALDDLPPFLLAVLLVMVTDLKLVFLLDEFAVAVAVVVAVVVAVAAVAGFFFFFCFPCQ